MKTGTVETPLTLDTTALAVTPATTTVYTLLASNSGGQTSTSTTIFVTAVGEETPTSTPPVIAPAERLFKYPNDPTVYLLADGTKHGIASWEIYLSHYAGVPIATLPDSETFPSGDDIRFGPGSLLKTPDSPTVWLVLDNNSRYGFASSEEFDRFGYRFDLVQTVAPEELNTHPLSGMTALSYHAAGQFVAYDGDPTVYRMDAGRKRPITSWAVLQSYAEPKYILKIPQSFAYHAAPFVAFPDGSLIRSQSVPTVYLIAAGQRRAIASPAALQALGLHVLASDDRTGCRPAAQPACRQAGPSRGGDAITGRWPER